MGTDFTWIGERNRPLHVRRPCACGCDFRHGRSGVGYLTGSDDNGEGFTIWIANEEVYQRLARMLGQENE